MSDDLDDFLRQAAERRAKRQQQKGGGSASNAPVPQRPASPPPLSPPQSRESSQPRRPQPPQPLQRPAPAVAEVIEEVRPTVGRLEPTIAARHVSSDLEQADEHMQEHLKSAFDHEIGSVGKGKKKGGKARSSVQVSDASPEVSQDARTASVSSMDLREQLRHPQTLRLAIIAHEILRRPYQ